MEAHDLISVIVPVYRAESFLRKCTDSILNQTFQDLELLLIDDGSPDASGAMCDAFSTALFVLGEEKALDFWRTSGYDFELVLVTEDGRVLVTEGLADRFEQTEGSAYRYELIPRADEARPG